MGSDFKTFVSLICRLNLSRFYAMRAYQSLQSKAGDTLGDFIRRSPRSAKIVCPVQRLRFSYKIADIWHVRYRRLNSPAFAKCVRSRDFLRSSLRIASKLNQSGWAILSHDFSKRPSMEPGNKVEVPHRRDRRKKSPGVSASIGGSLAIKFAAIGE